MPEEELKVLESVIAEQRQQLVDCERNLETETDFHTRDYYSRFHRQISANILELEKLVDRVSHEELEVPTIPIQPETPGTKGSTTARNRLNPRPGLVLADTYRLEKVLGKGGMGEVWLATHLLLYEPRAIKLVLNNRAANPGNYEQFIGGEARHALRLIHPNIVRVHDLGQQQETPYIVMEYVASGTYGADLKALIKAKGKLNLYETGEILEQVAAALEAAHQLGLVHCDLKPANILINANGQAKISDFGLVRDISTLPGNGEVGSAMGTPLYMSPEQAQGIVDTRSDIYSLGVILYELLVGSTPFTGKSQSVLIQHASLKPVPPHSVDPEIPQVLSEIVLKALAKDPAERFASASQMAAVYRKALDELKNNTPVAPVLTPHNLPEHATRLVGRQKEVGQITRILSQPDVQLLSLTGTGGTGKTRLALEVASGMLPDFPDGIYFVPLENASHEEMLVAEIAQIFGLKAHKAQELLSPLKEYLAEKKMLLLLDNFEQLAESSAVLGELINAAPNLKLLVTSRIALKLPQETEYALEPLSLPELKPSKTTPAELQNNPAVTLFVERAQETKKNFALTEENAADIAQICVKLDGLPLAIELAAARVKLLTARQILERLSDRFKLLTAGSLDLPSRQQTLRSTLDWSYELLTEAEKTLFARVSVFAGGCTVEAAEQICNATTDLGIEVLDGLESLAGKNLLKEFQDKEGQTRCVMLQTIRQYGLEKLESTGGSTAIHLQHSLYYTELAETQEAKLKGSEQQRGLRLLDSEYDNLRLAIEWSLQHQQPDLAARLSARLWRYWTARSYLSEGRKYLDQILIYSANISPQNQAKVMEAAAVLAQAQGDYAVAGNLYKLSLNIARQLGDKVGTGSILNNLGRLSDSQADYVAAETYYKESLEIARETNNNWTGAANLNNLGIIASNRGDYALAKTYYEESLALLRIIGDKIYISGSLNNLGNLAAYSGDMSTAHDYFEESLKLRQEIGDKYGVANSLANLGAVAYELSNFPLALSYYLEGLEIQREIGDKFGIAASLTNLGLLAYKQKNYSEGINLFVESLKLKQELQDKYGIAVAFSGLGATLARMGAADNTGHNVQKAVQLGAAAATLLQAINGTMQPSEREIYNELMEVAHTQLDEQEFNQYFANGQVFSLDEAITFALGIA